MPMINLYKDLSVLEEGNGDESYRSTIDSYRSPRDEFDGEDDEVDEGDFITLPPIDLEGDTFGMSVCSLTRDSYFVARHGFTGARLVRLGMTLFLAVLTIIIQTWLLYKVKEFVCARAVHDIRIAYDKYELAVYGVENCTLTVNGKHRGIPDRFPPIADARARLETLSLSDQDDICRIPLSQPYFFGLILVIWTLTCIYELRKSWRLELSILRLPTIVSMVDALGLDRDPRDEFGSVIKGMTICHKVGLTILTFVPRVCVCLYLLWIGCRWLLATNCFADLILNAVALEFILCIKETLYSSLMPYRNQFDLDNTKIDQYPRTMGSGTWNFTSSGLLLFVAIVWVVLYMGRWQQVLPGYNWDVHTVCEAYIKRRFEV